MTMDCNDTGIASNMTVGFYAGDVGHLRRRGASTG